MKTKKTFVSPLPGLGNSVCWANKHVPAFWTVFLLILGYCGLLHGQMNNWAMPPYQLNMTISPVGISALYPGAVPPSPYNVSNGAYDQNGSLLFYIQNYIVRRPDGTSAGQLGTNGTGALGGEIVILPFPGACRKFYVIYSIGTYVLYTIVDCYGAIQLDKGPGNAGYPVASFQYDGTGLAASKKTTDPSSAGFIYYLYMANGGDVSYSIVGNTGISPTTNLHMGSSMTSSHRCTELELSVDGNYLAYNGISTGSGSFISGSGNVEVVKLGSPTTATLENVYSSSSSVIYGLELVGNGIPTLYVVGEKYFTGGPPTIGIFDAFDVITGATTQLNPSPVWPYSYDWPYEVNKSFLEYSKSGKLCYISDSLGKRQFIEYDIPGASFTATQIDGNGLNGYDLMPNGVTGGFLQSIYADVYILPDQVDGENYNAFTTTPNTFVQHLTINDIATAGLDEDECVFNEVYNCNAINLNAYFNIEDPSICHSSIDIHQVNASCGSLVGTGYFNCNDCGGEFMGDDTPWSVDLRGFSANGLSLSSHTGHFIVTWNVTDCCGNHSSKKAHIRILGSLTPGINLEISDKTSPPYPWLPASTSIFSPVDVGSSSVAYQVTALSSGNITGYTTLIEEVDGTTGLPIGTLYNKTINTNNINSIGSQNLNTLCIDQYLWPGIVPTFGYCSSTNPTYSGRTGYWSFSNGSNSFQKYYKITITVFNPCSSSPPAYSYIYVGSQNNRMSTPTGIDQLEENPTPIFFPNPASDQLFISGLSDNSGGFSVELLDVTGRSVLHHSGNTGKELQSIDIKHLTEGVYMWKYESGGKSTFGKVQIMR